jgi:hypothetical protein
MSTPHEPENTSADENTATEENTSDWSHVEPVDQWESADRDAVHPGHPGVSNEGGPDPVAHPGGTDPEHPAHP